MAHLWINVINVQIAIHTFSMCSTVKCIANIVGRNWIGNKKRILGGDNMTVKKLIALLSLFPDDMNVMITYDRNVRNIDKVSTVTDVDTNIVSVDIVAKRYLD